MLKFFQKELFPKSYYFLLFFLMDFLCFQVAAAEQATISPIDSIHIRYTELIKQASDSLQKLQVFYDYGVALDEEGDLPGSIDKLEVAFRIAENTQNHKEIARIGNYLATNYIMSGDVDISTKTYRKALASSELTKNSMEIAKISMNLAENLNFSGDYNEAIKYGLYSLKIKESNEIWERICYHYMAMSNIFKETEDIAKREEYVLLAYQMKDKEGCASVSDIAKIYNGLGGIAEERFQHEKALAYYDTLKQFSEKEHFDSGVNTALVNSALVYQELKQFEKALELLEEADRYSNQTPYDTIFSNNCKTELYLSLGQAEKALELANTNFAREELVYFSAERLKCLGFLYEVNFRLKNYDEAHRWNDSLKKYEDHVRDEDVRTTIAELEMQYQTEKKEQQIELLQAENRIRTQEKFVYVSTSVALLLLFLVGTLLYFKNKRENQIQHLELRQQLLRSQMNPHFLFNALGSIQSFMYKNETKKAASYLGNFARLTRSILEQSAEEFILLADEIDLLQNYLKLEQIRGKNNFTFSIEVDDDIDVEFIKIPPMLVQPFVENAIKHGLRNINYPGELFIGFKEFEDDLHVVVRDNGCGINTGTKSKKESKAHRSMSMEIFMERQIVLSKKYKKEIRFLVTDLNETELAQTGTEVKLIIPL